MIRLASAHVRMWDVRQRHGRGSKQNRIDRHRIKISTHTQTLTHTHTHTYTHLRLAKLYQQHRAICPRRVGPRGWETHQFRVGPRHRVRYVMKRKRAVKSNTSVRSFLHSVGSPARTMHPCGAYVVRVDKQTKSDCRPLRGDRTVTGNRHLVTGTVCRATFGLW